MLLLPLSYIKTTFPYTSSSVNISHSQMSNTSPTIQDIFPLLQIKFSKLDLQMPQHPRPLQPIEKISTPRQGNVLRVSNHRRAITQDIRRLFLQVVQGAEEGRQEQNCRCRQEDDEPRPGANVDFIHGDDESSGILVLRCVAGSVVISEAV